MELATKPTAEEIKAMVSVTLVRDEYTEKPLVNDLVRMAKSEELKFFRSKGVWRIVPRACTQNQRVVGAR